MNVVRSVVPGISENDAARIVEELGLEAHRAIASVNGSPVLIGLTNERLLSHLEPYRDSMEESDYRKAIETLGNPS
jgi:hypothetical protein